jgi:hypothetical protein
VSPDKTLAELFKPEIVEIYAPVGLKSSFAADPSLIKSIQVGNEFIER